MTFLDTNICLDLMARRSPWHKDTEEMIRIHILQSLALGMSVISVPTLSFLIQKHHKSIRFHEIMQNILEFVQLLDVTGRMTEKAVHSSWKDVEDAIQHECAVYHKANCIITRNKQHFRQSGLPVFTVREWLDMFFS